ELLQARGAEMRADVMPRELFVALECLGRYLRRGPGFPAIKKLSEGCAARVDVSPFLGRCHKFGELLLGVSLGALEGVIPDLALSGEWVATDIEFQFPGVLAATADVAGHVEIPPSLDNLVNTRLVRCLPILAATCL